MPRASPRGQGVACANGRTAILAGPILAALAGDMVLRLAPGRPLAR
jgi:hypothetical protein